MWWWVGVVVVDKNVYEKKVLELMSKMKVPEWRFGNIGPEWRTYGMRHDEHRHYGV